VAGHGDYCVALWPGNDTKLYACFVDLRDRLPVVTVPLREPDQHVLLDLQQALSTMYERARLGQTVDYTGPVPAPALAPPDQAWVQRTIAVWREQPANG